MEIEDFWRLMDNRLMEEERERERGGGRGFNRLGVLVLAHVKVPCSTIRLVFAIQHTIYEWMYL